MGQAPVKLGLQDFLAWENTQPERHEFHRGEVFAMVGGRRPRAAEIPSRDEAPADVIGYANVLAWP